MQSCFHFEVTIIYLSYKIIISHGINVDLNVEYIEQKCFLINGRIIFFLRRTCLGIFI